MCFAFASGVLPPGIFEKQLKSSENCPNLQKVVTLYNEMYPPLEGGGCFPSRPGILSAKNCAALYSSFPVNNDYWESSHV